MKKEPMHMIAWGGLGGLVAASCCTVPFLLMVLGLSSITAGSLNAYLTGLRWVLLIPVGVVIASVGIYLQTKRHYGTCSMTTLGNNKVVAVVTMLLTFVVWAALVYGIIPFLWGLWVD
jgi:hypothetical protein